jgi:terminal uridylyltransferase
MVFGAKVPILTFKITRDSQILKGDISFENHLALQNTKLLAAYADFDERVAPLGLAIKKWASTCGINDASSHTFSSYGNTFKFDLDLLF